MAVGWQRWWGPCPAIDTRTGTSLLASPDSVLGSAGWLSLLTPDSWQRSRCHSPCRGPSPARAPRRPGPWPGWMRWPSSCPLSAVSVVTGGYQWSLRGHWCVFTGSLRIQHWLRDWGGTVECQDGTPGWPPVTRPGQPLRPPDGTACQESQHWQHCALLPFLHFSFCNSN